MKAMQDIEVRDRVILDGQPPLVAVAEGTPATVIKVMEEEEFHDLRVRPDEVGLAGSSTQVCDLDNITDNLTKQSLARGEDAETGTPVGRLHAERRRLEDRIREAVADFEEATGATATSVELSPVEVAMRVPKRS